MMEPSGPKIPTPRISGDMMDFIGGEDSFHYHILSYSWHGGEPHLQVKKMVQDKDMLIGEGDPFEMDLGEEEISWRISGPIFCTGRSHDGSHIPCPGSKPAVDGHSQCWECLVQDIPDPACIFEPRCNEGSCGAHFCQVPHVVYATAFRGAVKIGMTQFKRMKERAMEQGADGMLPLVELKDRYSARYFEGRISGTMHLPQVIRSPVKFRNLVSGRDLDEIADLLYGIKAELELVWEQIISEAHPGAVVSGSPGELNEKPILIDDYPLEEPLPSRPKRFKGERITGKVMGYKGSYMFYRQGSIWAYRLSETPGKVLSTGCQKG